MTKWMNRLFLSVLCMMLLMIAFTALGVAGLIFLCLAIFGYEKTWTLPVALGCNALVLLYQSIFRLRNK